MGSNPGAICWMDMTFFTLICCKNFIACLKRPKINEKEAGIGPVKKHPKLFYIQGEGPNMVSYLLLLKYSFLILSFHERIGQFFAMIKYLGTKKGCENDSSD